MSGKTVLLEQGQPKLAIDIGNITDRMGAFSTDIVITHSEQKKSRLMKQAKQSQNKNK